VLAQFDEFRRFRQRQPTPVGGTSGARKPEPAVAVETPEEALETAYQEARATLAKEMLTRLQSFAVVGDSWGETRPRQEAAQ
jgi:restriction endonuclease Mrr